MKFKPAFVALVKSFGCVQRPVFAPQPCNRKKLIKKYIHKCGKMKAIRPHSQVTGAPNFTPSSLRGCRY